MGNFSNNAITDVGRMLLADVQAGAIFTPTRIVLGSGSMPSGATTQGMTNVITPVKSLAINKKKRTPDGKCVFGGVYTNEEVTEAFYFRELALYAKAVYLNADGSVKSEGAETLYSYGNAGATADYMPAYSTSTVVEKQMDLVTWVGNEAQVDLTIESGLSITHEDFDSHAARHAAGGADPITPESIGAAPDGFGLGSFNAKMLKETDDLNDINQGGFYYWADAANAPFVWGYMVVLPSNKEAVTQIAYHMSPAFTGSSLRRVQHNWNTWGEWEWENPPLFVGVEYRTTERRDGSAVYKMLDRDGVLKYHLEGETSWKTYALVDSAAPYGLVENVYYEAGSTESVVAILEAELQTMRSNSVRHLCINDNTGASIFFGGMAHFTIYKVSNEYATVEAIKYHFNGVYKWRCSKFITWQQWEWENPSFDSGYEYRTTERYHGYAVIKKMDASGNILWRAEHETTWRLLTSASAVVPASVE